MVETEDPKLHIIFIHADHSSPVETIMTRELPSLDGKLLTVSMPKRMVSGSTEQDDENIE
jgi:hypothetical protein